MQRLRESPSSTTKDALTKITWLYHHRKLTQEQIAQELGLSRTSIVRFLRQAADEGLVTVSLRLDDLRRMESSTRLAERFGLKEAFIVPTSKADSEADGMRSVARTAALYLRNRLRPHQILAIAWGKTMLEVARALDENQMEGAVVAQSIGGLNSGEAFNPLQVTSLIGEKLHARIYYLYVPAVVDTKELKDILLANSGVRAALDVARQASCFMASIGTVENNATVVQTGFLDISTLDRLKARGAVGDISGHYFDLHGRPVRGDIEDRIMALSWEDLQRLENVVAVICGRHKLRAALGALRTGLLDALIIDEPTAIAVLESDGEKDVAAP
ncbi:MAG: sugar-binding transcriptional regulator [Verrucomicrobia bacterium]|nr:sugar-binding transcriptional regulator [Verrucomicrobiota bacterium]